MGVFVWGGFNRPSRIKITDQVTKVKSACQQATNLGLVKKKRGSTYGQTGEIQITQHPSTPGTPLTPPPKIIEFTWHLVDYLEEFTPSLPLSLLLFHSHTLATGVTGAACAEAADCAAAIPRWTSLYMIWGERAIPWDLTSTGVNRKKGEMGNQAISKKICRMHVDMKICVYDCICMCACAGVTVFSPADEKNIEFSI